MDFVVLKGLKRTVIIEVGHALMEYSLQGDYENNLDGSL